VLNGQLRRKRVLSPEIFLDNEKRAA